MPEVIKKPEIIKKISTPKKPPEKVMIQMTLKDQKSGRALPL